ncbi:hypothetical protein FACS1894130_05030 [Spirochaetia bacterium]|nr:hypothetical protein FACS1894130_05030 [Spirochaetia bacterium]
MFYDNDFIDGLENSGSLTIPKEEYAALQARNVAQMLKDKESTINNSACTGGPLRTLYGAM